MAMCTWPPTQEARGKSELDTSFPLRTDGRTLTRLRVATWGTGEEGRKIPGSTGDGRRRRGTSLELRIGEACSTDPDQESLI